MGVRGADVMGPARGTDDDMPLDFEFNDTSIIGDVSELGRATNRASTAPIGATNDNHKAPLQLRPAASPVDLPSHDPQPEAPGFSIPDPVSRPGPPRPAKNVSWGIDASDPSPAGISLPASDDAPLSKELREQHVTQLLSQYDRQDLQHQQEPQMPQVTPQAAPITGQQQPPQQQPQPQLQPTMPMQFAFQQMGLGLPGAGLGDLQPANRITATAPLPLHLLSMGHPIQQPHHPAAAAAAAPPAGGAGQQPNVQRVSVFGAQQHHQPPQAQQPQAPKLKLPQRALPLPQGGHGGKGGRGGSPKANGVEGGRGGKGGKGRSAGPSASPLLDEFRRRKSWDAARHELEQFEGHVAEFSRDQEGSRLIQKKLEMTSTQGEQGRQRLTAVFNELRPVALSLMTDVYGNYVVQKLLEHGAPEHRETLCGVMSGHVVELTKQTYGCRVVQKALDLVPRPLQLQLAGELNGKVGDCVMNPNGNHVVQKCIEVMPDACGFVIDAFKRDIDRLAKHPYGCRVIQKILEHAKRNKSCPLAEATWPMVELIVSRAQVLVTDQNGNYVVQHVMSNAPRHFSLAIVEALKDSFAELSCHKFASNVAEKVYVAADTQTREHIANSIVGVGPDTPLMRMVRDPFGNYVVQKMLDLGDVVSQIIVRCIKPQANFIVRTPYGKHILSKVDRPSGRGVNRS